MTVTITIDAAMIAHGVSAAAGLAATVGAARLVFGGAPPSGQWARRLRRAAMAALAGLWISGGWALMQSGLGPERLNGALAVKLVAAALVTLAFPAIVHGELRLSRHDAHPVRAAAILGAVSGGALGVWGGFYALRSMTAACLPLCASRKSAATASGPPGQCSMQ